MVPSGISSARRAPRRQKSRSAKWSNTVDYPVVLGLAWLVVLLLWLTRVLKAGGSVVFVAGVVAAALLVAHICLSLFRGGDPWRGTRRVVAVIVMVAVPTVFDIRVIDSFNVVKLTVLLVGSTALAAIWAVERLRLGRPVLWRCGLQWPLLVLVAWTALATMTGISPRASALGSYGSYDGLVPALVFALLFLSIVDSFGAEHLQRLLAALWFGAGGLAVLLGLLQLHDRITTFGGRWDWVRWGRSSNFPTDSVWSTLGNPNHLAGFLAVMLPLGVALFLTIGDRRHRAAIAVIGVAMLAELVATGTAGGWLACAASLVVTAALLAPEVRTHWRIVIAVPAAVVALAVATSLAVGPSRDLGGQLRAAFDLTGASTAAQRLGYWRAAGAMAADHPLVGSGPDTYELRFGRYQDTAFVRANGPLLNVNGPHNTFLDQLVSSGVPGLAALAALVVLAGLRTVGAWQRLRRAESTGTADTKADAKADTKARAKADAKAGLAPADATRLRQLLAGVAGALVAYLVQASFNVDQLTLSLLFWSLLGVLVVVTLAAGVPDSVRPKELLGAPASVPPAASPTSGEDFRATRALTPAGAVAAGGVCILALLAVILAVHPYAADRASYVAARWRATAGELEKRDEAGSRVALVRARDSFEKATRRDPWEPTYAAELGRANFVLAKPVPSDAEGARIRMNLLHKARAGFERALDLDVGSFNLLNQYAEVLIRISEVDRTDRSATPQALAVLRDAHEANPWQPRSPFLLSLLLEREGRAAEALATVDSGLALSPRNVDLLRQSARLHAKASDPDSARDRWRRLLAVVPEDPEARKAL